MKERKIEETYLDMGFGFPVEIFNAPMVKIRNTWTLSLNLHDYEKAVLIALSQKPARLTGNEVKFIRNYFKMDLVSFGKRFGDVAHSAVIKWEKTFDQPTKMNWGVEKDIRLHIVSSLRPRSLRKTYLELEEVFTTKSLNVQVNSEKLSVA